MPVPGCLEIQRFGDANDSSPARWVRRLAILLSIVMGGCAGVPTAQLQAYSNAYDEAKSAAALIYADAAPALRIAAGIAPETAASKKLGEFPVSLGPAAFDREGCGAAVASFDDLRARCQAMIALKAYNQALLDIAAGKTSDDILAQVDQAFRSVSTVAAIVPGAAAAAFLTGPVAAIFPALKGILGEALKLRDRAALRNALMQGAPQIRILIQALRDDVDRLYTIHRAYAARTLTNVQSAIDENVNAAFSVVAAHSRPTDAAVASTLGLLEQRFEEMFSGPEPSTRFRLKGIPPAGGGKPLDGPAVASVDASLRGAAVRIAEFKAAVALFNKSAEALARYDSLLAAVDRSFTELATASSQPFAAGGGTDQLVQSLVTIRDHARDIRQLLAAR